MLLIFHPLLYFRYLEIQLDKDHLNPLQNVLLSSNKQINIFVDSSINCTLFLFVLFLYVAYSKHFMITAKQNFTTTKSTKAIIQ